MFTRLVLSAVLAILPPAIGAAAWSLAELPPITSVWLLCWAACTLLLYWTLKRQEGAR